MVKKNYLHFKTSNGYHTVEYIVVMYNSTKTVRRFRV